MNEMVAQGAGALQVAHTKEQVELIKKTVAAGCTDDELKLFLYQCQRTGLDPLARQMYAVKRWDSATKSQKMTMQVSIDGFRLVAERTGKYAGQDGPHWCGDDGVWRDVWTSKEMPFAARVGVMRSDFTAPLYAVARFADYAQYKREGGLTAMWAQHGVLMVAKCAESLALRRAFPQELSGLYTSDEMSNAGEKDEQKEQKEETQVIMDDATISVELMAEVKRLGLSGQQAKKMRDGVIDVIAPGKKWGDLDTRKKIKILEAYRAEKKA